MSRAERGSTPPPCPFADPDDTGRFGRFGGRFVPETLIPALAELEAAFRDAWADPAFRAELDGLLRDYAGRPSPVTECERLSELLGVRVLLKREDLNHTGSHKINNVLGQALLDPAHGQAAGHRRDRRRPARRGHRHRRRPARPGVRGLHGRGGHGAPGAQRVPHAPAGRRGAAGQHRQPHPEGRGQRGHARLGGQRRVDPLLPRLGDGPAPVPVDGPRAAPGDRRRGP